MQSHWIKHEMRGHFWFQCFFHQQTTRFHPKTFINGNIPYIHCLSIFQELHIYFANVVNKFTLLITIVKLLFEFIASVYFVKNYTPLFNKNLYLMATHARTNITNDTIRLLTTGFVVWFDVCFLSSNPYSRIKIWVLLQ